MTQEPANAGTAADRGAAGLAVVDRATWQARLDELLIREKAHTHEGDAIAAAWRRLPMVKVDPAIPLAGEHGQGGSPGDGEPASHRAPSP